MKSNITKLLILGTILVWVLWDIYVYHSGGNPATESATLIRWTHQYPGFTFSLGILMGHIIFDVRGPIDWPKNLDKKP